MMDFGLFHTWNVLYEGGKVPWDPAYRGGKLLEEDAYTKNWEEMHAVEEMGWDYIWLGGGHFATVVQDIPGMEQSKVHHRPSCVAERYDPEG